MTTLTQERCSACSADSPHVTDEEVAQLQPQVPQWELVAEEGVRKLRRAFAVRDFAQALALADAVGQLAERERHHPLLTVEWGKVTVTWWTKKIRDLHRNDFLMSAKTDQLHEEMLRRGEIEPAPPRKSR